MMRNGKRISRPDRAAGAGKKSFAPRKKSASFRTAEETAEKRPFASRKKKPSFHAAKTEGKKPFAPRRKSAFFHAAEPAEEAEIYTFSDALEEILKTKIGSDPEPFSRMEYRREAELKKKALTLFLKKTGTELKFPEIVPAPQPRFYRSNSKRRCVLDRKGFRMTHSGTRSGRSKGLDESLLEPEEHTEIFRFIYECFSSGYARFAASRLNYAVIRGTEELAVILNFTRFDAQLIRTMKHFGKDLQERFPKVGSFFLYLDETRSDYYFETRHLTRNSGLKKIFGFNNLKVSLTDGRELYYPPVAFSQVNEKMLPEFLKTVHLLTRPEKEMRFVDLYCGYGLIGLNEADGVHSLIGVEIDGPASDAAVRNGARLFRHGECRFIRSEVSPSLLRNGLPPADGRPEIVVLDPPRGGTARGILKEISRREPERILHIICGTDTLPDVLKEWKRHGYTPSGCRVLDLFPGTANLETFLLLEKTSAQ